MTTHIILTVDLPENRVARKREQLENLAAAVQLYAQPGQVIVDFCAGSGHLGILVAYLLPQCRILLVENKEESIRRAENRIEQLGLQNVTVYQVWILFSAFLHCFQLTLNGILGVIL